MYLAKLQGVAWQISGKKFENVDCFPLIRMWYYLLIFPFFKIWWSFQEL